MSKFKPVLDGIKQNVESQGLAIPHFNRVPPENAGPQDVQQVLNELRILQQNNSDNDVATTVLGRAMDDITNLHGYDFQ